jgi:hypothetical protein
MKNSDKIYCHICKEQTNLNAESFGRWHLQKLHRITMREYYDKYIKIPTDGFCRCCGNKTRFISYRQGYRIFCSHKCSATDESVQLLSKSTRIRLYGDPTYNNRSGAVKTCLLKYNVINVSKLENIKKQKEETLIQNHGVSNMSLSPLLCHKRLQTLLNRYGEDNPSKVEAFKLKRMETTLRRYGELFYSRTEQYREYKENMGEWIPLSQKNSFDLYFLQVWRETKKHKKVLFNSWNGKCYYTGVSLITDKNMYQNELYATIDHKTSIMRGYLNNISFKEIGGIDNLCVCARVINTQKNMKTEIEFNNYLLNK